VFGEERICGVVAAASALEMGRQLRRAVRETRTIELRLDWLKSEREIARFLSWLRVWRRASRSQATLIATCRRREGGGRFGGSLAAQLVILRLAGECGCGWYDLEIESAERFPEAGLRVVLGKQKRITSFHDFRGTPRRLGAVMQRMERAGGEVAKVATTCRTIAESVRVLALARGKRGVIAVPMGEVGLPARVLALREGSALAYAATEEATAPGQLSLEEMRGLYRADRLDRKTRVYGVVGNPIGHSLGPLLHNTGFQARGMNAVYLPFLVREVRDFLAAIEPLGISGFSVTLPHKQSILRHLDDCDPLASQIGAANTVVVRGGGKLYGYNTDYVGVLRALERRVGLRGSRVLLVGAGGAARAAGFALAQGGAIVAICARRRAQARALARAVGGEAIERRRLRGEFFDAIVNATPVGMHPREDQSPLEARELNCRLVMDLIYRPKKTLLLELAERRGIERVSGVEMFLAQGTAQWEIWTGMRAPVAAMRRAVLDALRREERAGGHR
jgi:3-dehydroquinate dehydratase/shikimate dehydrogenase